MNLNYLRQLMGNDETMVQRFIAILIRELPQQVKILELALQQGDTEQVQITAHALKGQLGYLGATELIETIGEIETHSGIQTGDKAQYQERFDLLQNQLTNLTKALQLSTS